MATKNKLTTDSYSPIHFRPHGRVEFSVLRENVLVCEAIGPFNLELINAVVAVEGPLIDALVKQAKWGDIVIFKESAMTSPEVLASFTEYLRSLSASMRMPTATALVISSEVEGSKIMTQHYLKCYEEAGLNAAVFGDFDQALAWIDTKVE
ncbi:hypothetical protein [Pseudaeromonas paramecii]|uniref:STAS/SEC14 domain-containing protein n=1 Tax=Pseudaeromonas paramecii TaxID=2138166 RepID=A0ABP8Q9R3_9GAMM